MEIDLKNNDIDEPTNINRIEFTKLIIGNMKSSFDGKILVHEITNNSIIVSVPGNDNKIVVGIDDRNIDNELKLLAFVLIGAKNYKEPKISFHLNPTEDYYEIAGISLGDFSGNLISDCDEDYKYSVILGARYLANLFRLKGICQVKYIKDSLALKLPLIKNPNKNESVDFESMMPTEASVAKDIKARKLRKKQLMMDRKKDPAGYRKRSRAAKLRWKKYRSKYLQGMKKYHNSAVGKRNNKLKGRAASIRNKITSK